MRNINIITYATTQTVQPEKRSETQQEGQPPGARQGQTFILNLTELLARLYLRIKRSIR